MYLRSFRLRRYRGIGAEWATLSPLTTFNFFIGANNAGKSTFLNFVSQFLSDSGSGPSPAKQVPVVDQYMKGLSGPAQIGFGLPWEEYKESLVARLKPAEAPHAGSIIEMLRPHIAPDGVVWAYQDAPFGGELKTTVEIDRSDLHSMLTSSQWQTLWQCLTSYTGGDLDRHWIPETLQRLSQGHVPRLPSVKLIPAIRQVGQKDESFDDFSGRGVIDQLFRLQMPDHDARKDRDLFDKINDFLRVVTGSPEATIEVPHNRDHILVNMNNRVLPLSSLGTGIHDIIMIATFCTITRESIVCIEEPELHLHPLLQRKLISYLSKNTNNQYFISTHSPSFIDTPGANIFHVSLINGDTAIREANLAKHRYAICNDLGHRASDIIQSNAIIWVEGPSDRIYIKHWLRAVAPEFLEGIHFSIMFYGGRLLSHLSADDDDVTSFIELRALNRNLIVVMDSDKASVEDGVNSTKTRIQDEIALAGGVAWITNGREIENYVPYQLLHETIQRLYPNKYGISLSGGAYEHALYFVASMSDATSATSEGELVKTVDKVKVAREVCNLEADLDVMDLRERIGAIAALIQKANA